MAELLSGVLNSEKLPEPLRNSFDHAIRDFFNSEIDQSKIIALEKSPEYIAKILRGYKREAKNE